MILAIGIDIVEIKRIERSIERLGRRFIERIYTPAEIDYCDPKGARMIHFAGRFAAKEATMKALGTGWGQGVSWREVEILPSETGAPQLHLYGVARGRFEELGGSRAFVSISHSDTSAIAQVVFDGDRG